MSESKIESIHTEKKKITPEILGIEAQFDRIYRGDYVYGRNTLQARDYLLKHLNVIEKDLKSDNDGSCSLRMMEMILDPDYPHELDPFYRQEVANFVDDHFEDIAKRITPNGLNEKNMNSETARALRVLTSTLSVLREKVIWLQ